MTDFEKLNNKTCANAAYSMLEIAKQAIWDAKNFTVDNGWMQKDMDSMIDKINKLADVLWNMM